MSLLKMFKRKRAPLWLSSTQQIYGKKSKPYYIQGWLHNLHGPVQKKKKKKCRAPCSRRRKKVSLTVIKIFFFKNILLLVKHNRDDSDTRART